MEKKYRIHEDWVVVILGFVIIALALSGLVVPVPKFSWKTWSDLSGKVLAGENLLNLGYQFLFTYVIAIATAVLAGKPAKWMLLTYPFVFILSAIAILVAGNGTIKDFNLEAVIFSLVLGLIVRNFFTLPTWFRESLNAELFVKIGLVLLGTSVIFGDIVRAGALGLIQALVVVVTVWYFAFWVCRKLKIDEEMTMMISSAVSICGVSAAIATAGAIQGDSKKLSYVISLVLVTAIPMMVAMPYIANYLELPEEVTGAWLGGTIDTTGAVVAAGSLVGETALNISTIVKFSQNVLLGIAAFAISVYWTVSSQQREEKAEKPSFNTIWQRFPKFVLGFVAASLLFSFVIPKESVTNIKESLKSIQTLWFVLAFTSIGLETRFSDLFNASSRKPLIGFLTAQLFNILLTLVVAYLLFS